MKAIHLFERKGYFCPILGSTELESGFWKVTTTDANKLVGKKIYFHKRQAAPSFQGGIITGFRIQPSGLYRRRIIFRFQPKPNCRNVLAGDEWNRWINIKKESTK